MQMNVVGYQQEDAVARITLHGGESRNTLSPAVVRELAAHLLRADSDSSAKAILVDADGPVFCAGLEPGEVWISPTMESVQALQGVVEFSRRCSKPLVIAVQGAALGIGVALVAGAHVALAAQGTSFALTEIRVGQWPFLSWVTLAPALGSRRALELSLTGRVFNTADALAWGLIHEVTQPSELEDRALATASLLAAAPPRIVQQALEWSRKPGDPATAFLAGIQSPEAREGMDALREKRRPVWPAT